MDKTNILVCDHISYKCKMRSLLVQLCKDREKNILGSLGPANFQNLSVFLREANAEPVPMNTGVYSLSNPNQAVLAIGDVHGDLLALLSALYLGGVIGLDGCWTGGNTLVVQLGDIFDRGGRGVSENTSHNPREEIDILQYIHALNKEAREKSNGGVVSLVGNHEADRFIDPQAEIDKYETEFLVQGWGGVKAKRKLFQPKSSLAKYFAKYKPLIVQVNDFLFCHGGIVPDMLEPSDTVRSMNATWRNYLLGKITRIPDRLRDIYWNRDLSLPSPDNLQKSAECVNLVAKVFLKNGGTLIYRLLSYPLRSLIKKNTK